MHPNVHPTLVLCLSVPTDLSIYLISRVFAEHLISEPLNDTFNIVPNYIHKDYLKSGVRGVSKIAC